MTPTALHGDEQPIVGRDPERALLHNLLHLMLQGQGRLVVIGGPAGIGKTTIVRDLVTRARHHGALVLAGNCYDLTTTPPYGLWIEAFRSYIPTGNLPEPPVEFTLDGAAPGSMGITTRFQQTERFLSDLSEQNPLLVVLEDVHWADDASLDMLRFIARQVHHRRLLMIVTARTDELTPEHRFQAIMPAIVREAQPVRLDLRRLSPEAIEEMVSSRYRLSTADHQRLTGYLENFARGNPLYAEELIRTLSGIGLISTYGEWTHVSDLDSVHVPPLLQQTISRRLSNLSGSTRDALALAAVIGQEVPLRHWSLVSGLEDDRLAEVIEEATAAHVLEEKPGGHGLQFSHALLREAMYRSVTLPLRRVRHMQVAEIMAVSPDASPDTVAYHFQQAGDRRALQWFVRAGLRARSAAAWISAAQSFEAAAGLLHGNQERIADYGWLRFEAGFLQRFSGDAGSIDNLDAAEQAGLDIADPLLVALSQYARGSQRAMRGQVHLGLEDIERGIMAIDRVLEFRQVPGTEDLALGVIRSLLHMEDARVQGTQEPPLAEPEIKDRVNLQRGVLINWMSMAGRVRDTIAAGEAYVDAVSSTYGDGHVQMSQCITGRRGLGQAYAAVGRVGEAKREYALVRAGYHSQRDFAMEGETIWREMVTVVLPYEADDLSRRSTMIAEAIDTWSRCLGITVISDGAHAPAELPVDVIEGRWSSALQIARDHLTAPWVPLVQEALLTLAGIARARGEMDNAWEHLNRLLPHGHKTLPGDSFFAMTVCGLSLAAELAMDVGDLDAAWQWIDAHSGWIDWSGATAWQADNHLLRARAHVESENLPLARQQAEEAILRASDPRQPLWHARACRMLGRVHVLGGHLDRAKDLLQESAALALSCNAVFERAQSLVALALWHIRSAEPAVAVALLDDATEIGLQLGAVPMLRQIDDLKAQASAGLREIPELPDRLTAREREVLRLVASGMSNRQIANELFLSPRTVERHIANIYLKIDVHSKAEATAYATLHRLV